MTRQSFVEKVIRDAERRLGLPKRWWGDSWSNVYSPDGLRIKFSGSCWVVRSRNGKIISRHDSRESAIRKARTL